MLYFLIIYNGIRFGLLNLFNKNFKSSIIQRIHPSVKIDLFQNGKITLGRNLDFSRNCSIIATNNGEIIIGEKVFINQNCSISSKSKITIGDNCNFGPNVCIFDNDHKFDSKNGVSSSEYNVGEISIGSGTWLASNVVVLRNTTIGRNCVIGAGCIIKGNIPDATMVFMDNLQIQKSII